MTRTIGIYVYDDVEVLDFAGPYEVFTCASRVAAKMAARGEAPGAAAPGTAAPGTAASVTEAPFRVLAIGAGMAPLRARAGLGVLPEADFAGAGKIDVLIVPGGVVTAELAKEEVVAWIAATAKNAELTASVCTGAFLLARAGLLDGQEATTHWEDVADLSAAFPQVRVRSGRRWIDNGAIVTSAGISAGIDMSLHLVERLVGLELALRTARQMDYDWNQG